MPEINTSEFIEITHTPEFKKHLHNQTIEFGIPRKRLRFTMMCTKDRVYLDTTQFKHLINLVCIYSKNINEQDKYKIFCGKEDTLKQIEALGFIYNNKFELLLKAFGIKKIQNEPILMQIYGNVISNTGENKKIPLTAILLLKDDSDKEYIIFFHTAPKFIPAIFSTIEHLFSEAISCNLPNETARFISLLRKITWYIAHATPAERGSASINKMVIQTLAVYKNHPILADDDINTDIYALITPNIETFAEQPWKLFSPLVEQTISDCIQENPTGLSPHTKKPTEVEFGFCFDSFRITLQALQLGIITFEQAINMDLIQWYLLENKTKTFFLLTHSIFHSIQELLKLDVSKETHGIPILIEISEFTISNFQLETEVNHYFIKNLYPIVKKIFKAIFLDYLQPTEIELKFPTISNISTENMIDNEFNQWVRDLINEPDPARVIFEINQMKEKIPENFQDILKRYQCVMRKIVSYSLETKKGFENN